MTGTRVKVEDHGLEQKSHPSSNLSQVDSKEEVEDVVVREIDLYINPELSQQLYLLQYPLQRTENPNLPEGATPPTAIAEARIKPRHGLLEIDHPMPPSNRLDQLSSVTSEFADMTHRTFQSTTIPVTTHLCLGKFSDANNKSMHLVPLNNVRQMRPSFQHVDERGISTGDSAMGEGEEADVQNLSDVEKKPLVFQRKESERAAMARKSSYAYMKSSQESEDWSELIVNQANSEQQQTLLEAVARKGSQPIFQSPLVATSRHCSPETSYIQSLNYLPPPSHIDPVSMQFTGNDLQSVTARLSTLMKGSPIPYSLIRSKFDKHAVPDTLLLEALSVCAVMVQGNYCLNSRFLTWLSAPVKRTRNLILLLLQERGLVHRRRLLQVCHSDGTAVDENAGASVVASPETVLVLLKQVAKHTSEGWTLKIDEDEGHIKQYPQNARSHEEYWKRQSKRYEELLARYDSAGTTSSYA